MNTNRPYISVLFHDSGAADQLLLQVVDADRRLKELEKDYEIIILGENSFETAPESIKKIAGVTGIRFCKTDNTGKTDLIKRGMKESNGDFRLFSLSDEAPMIELLKLVDFLESDEEVDMAFGKRMDNGNVFNSLVSLANKLNIKNITDPNTSYICAKARVTAVFDDRDFNHIVELLLHLKKSNMEVAEIGVLLQKEPKKQTIKETLSFVVKSVKMFFISVINRFKKH